METPGELTIEKLFTQPIQNPCVYDLKLADNEERTTSSAFEQVKKIFVNGIFYTTEDKFIETEQGKTVLLNKVTKKEIEYVNKFMLSVGIEVVYQQFNTEDKDHYLRGLLYALEKNCVFTAKVTIDWKTQLIQQVNLKVDKENYPTLLSICKKHPEANYFIELYKPELIRDYVIKFVKPEDPDNLHVIYFTYADIKKYHYQHKYYDNLDKHVR
jgi:hypothetical protein|uniref:Uncharacterized protein n=1 Tax=viral metagenome TaxID=1070528 RepID=A0A6C0INF2_9ZZZZ